VNNLGKKNMQFVSYVYLFTDKIKDDYISFTYFLHTLL